MLLNGINSIVLLFALAVIDTSYSPDSDAHLYSSSSDLTARAGTGLYPGDTIKAAGHAFASFEFARFTLRPATQVRSDNPVLLSLVKGALGSLTGHLGGAARAGYLVSTSVPLIGIRG